ncbi:MAG TPA: TraR/DksA C4-type zinc finger protein [Planctomycetaceae bacterium]|nr:TraR/DksA C4-type zinc finger protein [Planctomycetaceae bacterium]
MTPEQLKNYRDRLWKLVLRLQRDATTVSEQAFGPTGGQADGGLSNAPMHLGDMGTEAYLQELNATLLENQEYLVKEAMEAIRRIDDGTFGRCENCGRPIIKERLDAVPSTRHCAQCAEALNPGPSVNLNVGRPQHPTAAMADGGNVADRHAAGTAGGGTAVGGLAGTNEGRGDPDAAQLESASASSHFDSGDAVDRDNDSPRSGRSGGAVGGTPAGKRARGATKAKSRKTGRPRA